MFQQDRLEFDPRALNMLLQYKYLADARPNACVFSLHSVRTAFNAYQRELPATGPCEDLIMLPITSDDRQNMLRIKDALRASRLSDQRFFTVLGHTLSDMAVKACTPR